MARKKKKKERQRSFEPVLPFSIVASAASILKGLGHQGLDALFVTWGLDNKQDDKGRTLAQRTAALANAANADSHVRGTKRRGLGKKIVAQAVRLIDTSLGRLPNLSRQECDAFLSELEQYDYLLPVRTPKAARPRIEPVLPEFARNIAPKAREPLKPDRPGIARQPSASVDAQLPDKVLTGGHSPVDVPADHSSIGKQDNTVPRVDDQVSGNGIERSASPIQRSQGSIAKASLSNLESRLTRIERNIARIADTVDVIHNEILAIGIGDNNPPNQPEILDVGVETLDEASLATGLVRDEIAQSEPGTKALRLSTKVLERSAGRVKLLSEWLGARGTIFIDSLLDSAGRATGKVLVTSAALKLILDELHVDLVHVTEAVRQFLIALSH